MPDAATPSTPGIEAVRWQLRYGGDVIKDEYEHSDLSDTPPNALVLLLCIRTVEAGVDLRRPIQRVDLLDVGDPRHWQPIFYRIRTQDTHMNGTPIGPSRLAAVVFGRARESEHTVDGKLFALLPNRTVVSCPERYIDQGAIARLTLRK